MIKLKPCPFCGGAPELVGRQVAYCEECNVTLHINRWNCRTGHQRYFRLVERMKALLLAVEKDCTIICFDVDGKNWFDVRDAALPAAERGE